MRAARASSVFYREGDTSWVSEEVHCCGCSAFRCQSSCCWRCSGITELMSDLGPNRSGAHPAMRPANAPGIGGDLRSGDADRKCRPSLHRYAAHLRQGRNLGNALDGKGAADDCGDFRALCGAHDLLPLHHACEAGSGGRPVAVLFPALENCDPTGAGGGQLDLVPELARYVPPAAIIDKGTYSAFFRSPLANLLVEEAGRAPSSSPGRRPTSACCRRCWMRSISASAS